MTIVHLVRHGETVWHHENRYAGSSDIELTDRGRAQASTLAEWARTAGLTHIVSSDLGRAIETAAAAATVAALTPVVEPALREVDFGRGEGMTTAEMAAAFPEELAAFHGAPASSPLPGGELGAAAAARGLDALAGLAATAGPDGVVLAVVHTTLIRLMLCRMLGLPLDEYRRRFPRLDNVAITSVKLPEAAGRDGGDASALLAGVALLRYNAAPVPQSS